MAAEPIFDVRTSVRRRNIVRMIIVPAMAVGLVYFGFYLIPDTFVWSLSVDAIKTWNGWAFVGMVFIGSGIGHLIKTAIFALRARNAAGEWHFRLTSDDLLWHVPDHAHGPETGFHAALSDIKALEFRTIKEYEKMDIREHWIHFRDRDSIQLRDYTGISVSWLVSKIHEAGVPYDETIVEK